MASREGRVLWTPSGAVRDRAHLSAYLDWMAQRQGRRFAGYEELWRWSTQDLQQFWASIWTFCGVRSSRGYETVLSEQPMPGSSWFSGAQLNYAAHALDHPAGDLAIISWSEARGPTTLTYGELAAQVGAAAAGLRRLGVGPGDRVGAYLPNVPEAVVALLAAASIGAVWSACAPEMGTRAVLDRLGQVRPKVLVAVDGYRYGGVDRDRSAVVEEIVAGLPGLAATVAVGHLRPDRAAPRRPAVLAWSELVASAADPEPVPVDFDHPLWVLYSSGSTGPPKAIVHGHGGMLVEHLKYLTFHADLGRGDRFFWFTTTGWMMWNFLVAGLLVGSTCVLYDGSPAWPDPSALWRLAEATGTTYFGTSAPFLLAQRRVGADPARGHDLSAIRGLGSTGAPLPAAGFEWVYEHVGADLVLGSVSGGTDVCTAFVASCPLLPVHAGESQCRALGAAVEVYDGAGAPVVDQIGELVLTRPMPCMPVALWGDAGGSRYREAYFATYPGVWRHGDWARLTPRGTVVITGRSDATLNRGGVRMGSAELYQVVEDVDGIEDSLVIDTSGEGAEGRLVLFLVPSAGRALDSALRTRVVAAIRSQLSPRHVPDQIHRIAEVPRTLSGKKLEVPVKRLLAGARIEDVVDPSSLASPSALQAVLEAARGASREGGGDSGGLDRAGDGGGGAAPDR